MLSYQIILMSFYQNIFLKNLNNFSTHHQMNRIRTPRTACLLRSVVAAVKAAVSLPSTPSSRWPTEWTPRRSLAPSPRARGSWRCWRRERTTPIPRCLPASSAKCPQPSTLSGRIRQVCKDLKISPIPNVMYNMMWCLNKFYCISLSPLLKCSYSHFVAAWT